MFKQSREEDSIIVINTLNKKYKEMGKMKEEEIVHLLKDEI